MSSNMKYLAHTAHWQFLGLVMGAVAWILTMCAAGLNEWRLWHVADESVVASGVAWVGIWRACFYSHHLPSPRFEFCRFIDITDQFVPVEIFAAQVMMMLAIICGLAGNITAAIALRMAYFAVDRRDHILRVFLFAGTLYVLTGLCCLVPLFWNMNSVLANNTINFPHEYYLPAAPVRQEVGYAIGVGIVASVMIILSGLLFLRYALCNRQLKSSGTRPGRYAKDPLHGPVSVTTVSPKLVLQTRYNYERRDHDNPVFSAEEDP